MVDPGELLDCLIERAVEALVAPPQPIPTLRDPHNKRVYVFARTLNFPRGVEVEGWEKGTLGGRSFQARMTVAGGTRMITVLSPNNMLTECTLLAARRVPWNPEAAVAALKTGLTDVVEEDKVFRLTAGHEVTLPGLYRGISDNTDTFTVIGHVLAASRAESRLRLLESVIAEYPWLLNAVLLIDPSKLQEMRRLVDVPESWVGGLFTAHAYATDPQTMTEVAELYEEASPPDLHMDTVRDWARNLAEARCSFRWPHRAWVHALAEHFADRLRGSHAQPAHTVKQASAAQDRQLMVIEDLQGQLATEKERVRAEAALRVKAETDLHACEGRLTRSAADVKELRKQLGDADRHVKELEADLHTVSQGWGSRIAGTAGESAPREIAESALRAPRGWEELVECASHLKHVSLPPEAAEAAVRKFAHDRLSGLYLENTWAALLALDAWMELPSSTRGTFSTFARKHPQEGLPPGRVVSTESRMVARNPKMREARTFPTASGERQVMLEHVRIGNQSGSTTGRLHFRADPERNVVDVGYVGPHLLNPLATRV